MNELETKEVPPMKVKMQIMNIQIAKEPPGIKGIIQPKKHLDIFTVHALPVSVLESQNMGWEKIKNMGLERFSDKLAKEYSENMGVFSTYIPMTRHTIDVNKYEPGSIFTLEVKGFEQ